MCPKNQGRVTVGEADGIGGEAGKSRTAVVNWDSRGGEPDSV